jgi:hypothetical protein
MPERNDRAPVSSDYLRRHGVSAAQLDYFIVSALSRADNPGLSWPEFAQVAEDVATRWDSVDGKLALFDHFKAAVERRSARHVARVRTTVKFRNPQKVLDEARVRVNAALDRFDEAMRSLDRQECHVITDLEPTDEQDRHGGISYDR